ncbi:recombinase RecX [Fructilactobacillus lindneri]|uniref:Regulatory protein RecX n=2 Tax=Fructilactobacillus lindneri TaxID=53444 RepID=A0A0R2JN36_9LACO|nr:recombination regulator RecX [Fructilactobacillus lindneri]ANZ57976.1 recombinase RecX [Fructilactobacillus lindneri]ANZ59246.1 recombinase RecX [Fructilactobacillus lindneri]KRN78546.1 regulatory protein recX [Fructilactobacillus lindneri DSM 20690 = JCM 11027]POG98298.1 recombinase RecX [Fructilactobacillus lindneri]POH01585.1 recombinase RecX [Fructilactobacillus lindneri]
MKNNSQKLKISRIEAQKRPGRYNVYINNEYAFPISEEVLIKYMIFKGSEFTSAEIEQIKAADNLSKLYGKAVDFISYRQRTQFEVEKKLKDLTDDEIMIANVIERLIKIDLINDKNYAKNYIRQVADGKNKGPGAATRYLQQKGVAEAVINDALKQYYSKTKVVQNAQQIAQKLFDHYNRYPYNKRIEKVKLTMMRKGFSFDDIDQVLDLIDKTIDENQQNLILKKTCAKVWKKYHAIDSYQRRQKVKQALYRKGFDLDDIDQFLDDLEG